MANNEKKVKEATIEETVREKAANAPKQNIFKRIGKFFKDLVGEIKKIVWPTKKQILNNLIITVAMLVLVGVFVWLIDTGSSSLIKLIYGFLNKGSAA